MRVIQHWKRLPREAVAGNIQGQVGQGLEQPELKMSQLTAGGLEWMPVEVPPNPNCSMIMPHRNNKIIIKLAAEQVAYKTKQEDVPSLELSFPLGAELHIPPAQKGNDCTSSSFPSSNQKCTQLSCAA